MLPEHHSLLASGLILARMNHPALPRMSDHFGEGDGQLLVMQYIDGDDLALMMAVTPKFKF